MSSLRSEVHDAIGNRNLADDQFKVGVWWGGAELACRPLAGLLWRPRRNGPTGDGRTGNFGVQR